MRPRIGLFGLGLYLGFVAISMWEQWSLTFGLDPQLLLAVSVVLSLAFWWGPTQRQLQTNANRWMLAYLILCLCAWSLLHPFWIESITFVMASIPLAWLEQPATKALLSLVLALVGWSIPAVLWSSVIACSLSLAKESVLSARLAFATVFCGIAGGLILDSLFIAPRFGVFIPTIVTTALTAGLAIRLRHYVIKEAASAGSGVAEKVVESRRCQPAYFVRSLMACLLGGLLAGNLRLVNQLMPHGAFVIYVQLAGLLLGIAVGLIASNRLAGRDRAAWGGLSAAAAATVLFALQPALVNTSLWMNSTLTSVQYLLATRAMLLMAIPFPFGVALAWLADSTQEAPRPGLIAWGMPFGMGISLGTFALGGIAGLLTVMTVCCVFVVIGAGYALISSSAWKISLRTSLGLGSLAAVALSLPCWWAADDASRTAKLLFSTPTLLAYRFGWDLEHLPFLDDVRMIERREGSSGPLTLWRGRVAELFIRESGYPRAVITKNSDAVPQFAPDVLQAVYSMVICDQPDRVLCLGLSAGVPLSTCLSFPIREVVCIEGDSNLISLVQGPLARETGYDPLSDDRVTLHRTSPELALLAQPGKPFDVILSTPPPSSLTDGSPQYTQEFYQRASRQLSDRGLFCQRFECVDYGLRPIQLVLKAMRSSFTKVIAIEPAAGELLLFAANSDVFVPSELAARLETPHVSQILARCGLDWSALLNLPAFDDAALGEVCDESRGYGNSTFKGQLAAVAPFEMMRWGDKHQEIQVALTATRVTPAPFWNAAMGQSKEEDDELHLSRRSRLVEWLGDARITKELLRRLGEIVEQQKLVRENPDAHWWAYRKVLKKQLTDRPRTVVQQVKAIDEKQTMHPEDVRRRDYFIALGNAVRQRPPTRDQIAAVEQFFQPYDPLLSYFARQETADLLARANEDAACELACRLHVIYFAPTIDASVRNVAKAVQTIVNHPESIPQDSIRFDALNGLIQTLRVRWELRQSIRETSTRKVMEDIDQSLLAIEKGVESMDALATSAGVSHEDWRVRKEVIERLMLRPLRSYRNEVHERQIRGRAQARAIIEEAEGRQEPVDPGVDGESP